jgi:hypothetical protein
MGITISAAINATTVAETINAHQEECRKSLGCGLSIEKYGNYL